MTSPDGHRRRLAQLKKDEAKARKGQGDHEADAAKHRRDAARKRESAAKASSAATQRSRLREAESLERRAAASDKKAAASAKHVATIMGKQQQENRALSSAESSEQKRQDRDTERRQHKEKEHAREVARLQRPVMRYIHDVREVPAAKPEVLRVAYLTANPRVIDEDDDGSLMLTHIRVDLEMKQVKEAVKRSVHRDYINIDHWPAATRDDVVTVLNDFRPHVVHFSGHGGNGILEFDNGEMIAEGVPVSFEYLTRALSATDTGPTVLILNACDTLDGADILLDAVPVVIATAREIEDAGALVFAVSFYSAIASGQSIRAALDQARLATHTKMWKRLKVRPGSGASDPYQTEARYCVYDEPFRTYVYTPAWVKRILKEIGTVEKYSSFFGCAPPMDARTAHQTPSSTVDNF